MQALKQKLTVMRHLSLFASVPYDPLEDNPTNFRWRLSGPGHLQKFLAENVTGPVVPSWHKHKTVIYSTDVNSGIDTDAFQIGAAANLET
jgi:hypothetical protein